MYSTFLEGWRSSEVGTPDGKCLNFPTVFYTVEMLSSWSFFCSSFVLCWGRLKILRFVSVQRFLLLWIFSFKRGVPSYSSVYVFVSWNRAAAGRCFDGSGVVSGLLVAVLTTMIFNIPQVNLIVNSLITELGNFLCVNTNRLRNFKKSGNADGSTTVTFEIHPAAEDRRLLEKSPVVRFFALFRFTQNFRGKTPLHHPSHTTPPPQTVSRNDPTDPTDFPNTVKVRGNSIDWVK